MPHKSLLIVPSIKAVTDGGAIVPIPKLGFIWKAAEFFTLKNNYFRSFKYPNFDDLYWAGGGSRGNPDLEPENGWGTDLGVEFRYQKILTFDGTIYAQWMEDSIQWHRGASGLWEPANIGKAAFFGADARLRTNIPVSWGPVKKINPALSYQYLLSYLLGYGYDWGDNKRVPYQPMHTIGASVDIQWGSGSLLVSGHYESVRYYSATNLVELDPYLLLTLNLSQKIGENITLLTVIRNLLNQSYESYNRYPMPGLTLTLGMRMNFEAPRK
jgi:vitamin B12 transporter